MILSRDGYVTEFLCDFTGCTRTIQMFGGMTGDVFLRRWTGARREGWTGHPDGEHDHRCPIHSKPEAA